MHTDLNAYNTLENIYLLVFFSWVFYHYFFFKSNILHLNKTNLIQYYYESYSIWISWCCLTLIAYETVI